MTSPELVKGAKRSHAASKRTTGRTSSASVARSRASGPRGRRAKKVYGITHQGEERLVELLLEPSGLGTNAEFGLRLCLFRHGATVAQARTPPFAGRPAFSSTS